MMFDIRALDNTAWLLEPAWIKRAAVRLQQFPSCPTARDVATEHKRRMEVARNIASTAVRGVKGKIGIIPIYGMIEQRTSPIMEKLGGTSTEEIGVMLDVLLADKSVDAIVYDVDSPGGTSYGVEELSDKMFAARERKKTYSIANSMSASAGQWLSSSAGFSAATLGADVGSIGVYCVHIDESKAIEAQGLTVTMVTAGKYKTEYSPFAPLSDEARENLQMQVDVTYGKFLNAMKRNRNTSLEDVRKNYGQGRLMNAQQAKDVGMIDRVMTMEELLTQLMGKSSNGTAGRVAASEVLRLRHEHRKRTLVA